MTNLVQVILTNIIMLVTNVNGVQTNIGVGFTVANNNLNSTNHYQVQGFTTNATVIADALPVTNGITGIVTRPTRICEFINGGAWIASHTTIDTSNTNYQVIPYNMGTNKVFSWYTTERQYTSFRIMKD